MKKVDLELFRRNQFGREIWRYAECPWYFDKPESMTGEETRIRIEAAATKREGEE